jgi:hypothetical protein
MHSYLALGLWKLAAVGIAVFLATTTAHAQTDEIQVYDAEINNPGQFSLQLHNNYTPIGRKEPDFPGGIVPNHTLNGVPEWAYGVVDWLELGAYMPVYSWTGSGQPPDRRGQTARRVCRATRRGTSFLLRRQLRAQFQCALLGADPQFW